MAAVAAAAVVADDVTCISESEREREDGSSGRHAIIFAQSLRRVTVTGAIKKNRRPSLSHGTTASVAVAAAAGTLEERGSERRVLGRTGDEGGRRE